MGIYMVVRVLSSVERGFLQKLASKGRPKTHPHQSMLRKRLAAAHPGIVFLVTVPHRQAGLTAAIPSDTKARQGDF